MKLILPFVLGIALLGGAVSPAIGQETEADKAREQLAEIQKGLGAAVKKWREDQAAAVQAAIDAGKPIPAMRMSPPAEVVLPHLKKAQQAAAGYARRDEAIPFHLWVMRHGNMPEGKAQVEKSINLLFSDHMRSEELKNLPSALARCRRVLGPRVDGLLRKLGQESPHLSIRAGATVERLMPALRREDPNTEAYRQAKAVCLEVARLAQDRKLLESVKTVIAQREAKDVGAVAPDIEGVDLDGVAFKLSDYKGKIILLDFWGDW